MCMGAFIYIYIYIILLIKVGDNLKSITVTTIFLNALYSNTQK